MESSVTDLTKERVDPSQEHQLEGNTPLEGNIPLEAKVYGWVIYQLTITTIIAALIYIYPQAVLMPLFWVSLGIAIICILVFGCYLIQVHTPFIIRFLVFNLFTLSMSYMLGVGVSGVDTRILLVCALTTMIIFVVLSAIVWKLRLNLIHWGTFLFSTLTAILIVGFVQIFVPFPSIVSIIVSVISILLFCGYILYDTSRLLNRQGNIDPLWIAMGLYIDILNLFLQLVKLVQTFKS